jgi:hypothetical protein
MATTTKIHVTACDNELYILASTPAGSSEICHLKSGYNNPVNYEVTPQSILPPGNYTLTMIGINWGGPTAFKVTLITGGVSQVHSGGTGTNPGVTWSQAVAITV